MNIFNCYCRLGYSLRSEIKQFNMQTNQPKLKVSLEISRKVIGFIGPLDFQIYFLILGKYL